MPTGKIKRFFRSLRREGVSRTVSSTIEYIAVGMRRRARALGILTGLIEPTLYHNRKRTDSELRWEMIVKHLDSNDTTALDIGCADGFFTAKLADEGMTVEGIDVKADRLASARKAWGDKKGVKFTQKTIDPESIRSLPNVDVVLLLTVYHHWVTQNGRDVAEVMLRELATRSNKIFFEPPGTVDQQEVYQKWPIGGRPVKSGEKVAEYYLEILESVFDSTVSITYIGEAEYTDGRGRTDPLFVINCRDYRISE